jgi:O-6-methylguanine DNA methyltransferase
MTRSDYCLFETALGWCGIAWSESGDAGTPPAVTLFQLPEATAAITESRLARHHGARPTSEPPAPIAEVIERVRRHLAGKVEDFRDIPVALDRAGSFERLVYDAARNIPAGTTMTYGEIAKAIGQPGAAQAVGQALGRNPIPLIIPCHRVLAAGGKPGGFSAPGGLATKAKLLAGEGVAFARAPAKAAPEAARVPRLFD